MRVQVRLANKLFGAVLTLPALALVRVCHVTLQDLARAEHLRTRHARVLDVTSRRQSVYLLVMAVKRVLAWKAQLAYRACVLVLTTVCLCMSS